MKTHFFKRGIAGLLSLVMCLSAFIGLGTTTAFAAGEQAEVYLISFPRSGDANLDYSGTWGHSNLHYMNGWYSGESKYTTIRAMHSYDGNICYCIEPGVQQDTGDTYAENAEEFNSFVSKCKELSFYDTGVTAEYGDKLITLSTCEYSRNNSRLVVVAKRITEDGGADAAKTHAEATAEGERPN